MRRFGWLLLPLVLVLAGCGLVDRAVDKAAEKVAEKALETATGVSVDQNGESVTIKGQDGKELTIQSSDAKLPDGFPIQVHPGAKVITGGLMTTDGKKAWTGQVEFDGDIKPVADYYESAFKALGVEVSRMETNADGEQMVMFTGESAKLSVWATVSLPKEGKGSVTLILGDK